MHVVFRNLFINEYYYILETLFVINGKLQYYYYLVQFVSPILHAVVRVSEPLSACQLDGLF